MFSFIILPFIKLIMIFGSILFLIEKLIYFLISPVLFIFTTIDVEEFVNNTSIIAYLAENYFVPFCEKQGIYIERK